MSSVNEQLKGIHFHHLIGDPLKACIAAQEQASLSTWHYIRDVGLEDGKDAVMVSFSFINNGAKAYLRVPLLTLVPVPYFSIDTLEISFRAKVTGIEESARSTSSQSKIMATYAMTTNSSQITQIESTLDVSVRATQDHIPSGLSKVLGFMEQAVTAESIYLQLRDGEIARALARGCARSIPQELNKDYTFGGKEETGITIKFPKRNNLDRSLIPQIKALNIPHDKFPFLNIDDLGAFHSLYAFKCTKLNLSQVQSFSMSRLSDVRYLELWGTGQDLSPQQHRANMDFGWLEQIYTLILAKWGSGFISKVLLTSSTNLAKLVIKESTLEVVDISYCDKLEHLTIENSRIKRLIVWRNFEHSQKKYSYTIPRDIEIIKR